MSSYNWTLESMFSIVKFGKGNFLMPCEKDVSKRQGSNSGFQEINKNRARDLTEGTITRQEGRVRHDTPERILTAQRDLELLLASTSSASDVLRLCLDTALQISGLDSGGIYTVDPTTGELSLACAEGLSDRFCHQIHNVDVNSEKVRKFVSNQPAYLDRGTLGDPALEDVRMEGITALGIIPIRTENRLIGLMNIASRRLDHIPPGSRDALESIATLIGFAILRARDDAALRASEKRFRDLAEKTITGIYILQDGVFQYVNARCSEIFGYRGDEMIGLTLREVTFPDDWPTVRDALKKRVSGEIESRHYENRICKKNGELRLVETYSSATSYCGNPAVIGTFLDITDQRQAEEKMRKSEARLRQVIDLVPHGIFAKNHAGQFILVNQAVADIYRTSVEDLTGKYDSDFNPDAAEIEHFRKDDLAVMDSGRAKVIPEEPLTNAAGETRILRTVKIPFTLSLSEDKAILGVFTDITEQKKAEKALQESEEKYRNLFESAVEGIYQSGPDGRLLNVNPALARMAGYDSPQAMISANINPDEHVIVSPEDKIRLERLIAETGAVNEYEMRMYRKDGSIMWAAINIRPVHDEHGAILNYEGAVQDITWRKSAEQALKESEAKYRSVVESSLMAFYIIQDNLLRYVNGQFCTITGYSREELLDVMSPFDLVHPDDHAKVREKLERHFADPSKERQYTFRVIRKDGRIIDIKVFGGSMDYNGRYAVCGTAIDITNEIAMETQLRQAQKMESVGTLAGGIAHDFNNILGGLIGYTEMAEMETAEPRTKSYLEQVLRACDRAKNLVNQILAFSRPKENEKKALSITSVVKEVLKLIRSTLPSTVEVRLGCGKGRDTVLADANQIHQVLINLCTNAAHAMGERGGVLDIHLSHTDNPADLPEELPGKGPHLRMVIKDTGHGIGPSIIDKIFDPFYTTKAPGEGTGLGLSMVYGIVKNHDGAISVTSTPGEGTAFTIHLPLIDYEPISPEQRKKELPAGRERVLFVDDDELIAEVGKEMLSKLGYDVTVQAGSQEALALFRTDPDGFDLVITDKTMPNMTGDILAAELLKLRPDLPIIMASGFSDKMNEVEAKKIGIREFVMKPFSLDHFAHTVRKVLDGPSP